MLSTLTQGGPKQDTKEDRFPRSGNREEKEDNWDYQLVSEIQLHKHGCPVPLKVSGISPSLLLPFQAGLSCKSCVVPASHTQISQMPKAVANYIRHLLKQLHSSFNKECANRLFWFSLSSVRASSHWLINYCNNNPFLTILRMFVSPSLIQNLYLWFYEYLKQQKPFFN